jgi:hypothetical protein
MPPFDCDKLCKRDNLLYRELEDESVVFDPEANTVHSLNITATVVWNNCDGKQDLQDITEKILDKFDVPQENATEDVKKIINNFRELRLLKK